MADIEVVIKIPEEEYRWIIKSDKNSFANIASKECMMHAIKNGTPLPKGHGRLIDADALIHWRRLESKSDKDIANAPTIIEADTESEDNE